MGVRERPHYHHLHSIVNHLSHVSLTARPSLCCSHYTSAQQSHMQPGTHRKGVANLAYWVDYQRLVQSSQCITPSFACTPLHSSLQFSIPQFLTSWSPELLASPPGWITLACDTDCNMWMLVREPQSLKMLTGQGECGSSNHDHACSNHIYVTSPLYHQVDQTFPLFEINCMWMFVCKWEGSGYEATCKDSYIIVFIVPI